MNELIEFSKETKRLAKLFAKDEPDHVASAAEYWFSVNIQTAINAETVELETENKSLRSIVEKLVEALEPFKSGVDFVSWGYIKAHLNTEAAAKLTRFNYRADEAIASAKAELAKWKP